jgi:hypothetical protein
MPTRPVLHTAVALLLGTLSLAAGGEPRALQAEEVRALLAGNTLQGESQLARFRDRPDRHFEVYIRPDGSLVIRNFEGETDTGVWEVTTEGLFCNQYRHTRRGMHKCYSVEPIADGYALRDTDTGEVSTSFTMREGTPEWLEEAEREVTPAG